MMNKYIGYIACKISDTKASSIEEPLLYIEQGKASKRTIVSCFQNKKMSKMYKHFMTDTWSDAPKHHIIIILSLVNH